MSFFTRSRKAKASQSHTKKSQAPGDGSQATLGERNNSCSDVGGSLFSGMNLTSTPVRGAASSDEVTLIGDTDVTMPASARQQSESPETVMENQQDFAAVLVRPGEAELLPEPIQPTLIPQQVSQAATKKKRTRHIVRPGYARQPDSKGELSEQTDSTAEKKICDTEQEAKVEAVATSAANATKPEQASAEPSTPLYSIGTPSSSDENLFEDVKAQIDDEKMRGIPSKGTLQDEFLALNISPQLRGDNFLDDNLTDSAISGHLETESEFACMEKLEKTLEVSNKQSPEGNENIFETNKYFDSVEDQPEVLDIDLDDSFAAASSAVESGVFTWQVEPESTEQNVQYVEDGLKQATLGTALESCNLDVPSEKLDVALKHLKLQLTSLSGDKRCLTSLEEELSNVYTESYNVEDEKEQEFKRLQLEESQALASDNYDLAEEISDRMEQLKQDLECARYRLPAEDDKVEKALKLRAEVAEREAKIYRQNQTTLQEVREEQQECLASHREMHSTWSAREKQRLNSDRQRLERTMDHLRLDREHMEAEGMELSKEILQKTEEFQTRKEELLLERGALQGEISALEAKLAKLKVKESELTGFIKEQDDKIESVKLGFNPQQRALDKQQQEIERRETLLQEEFELLSSSQEVFDDKTEENYRKEQELSDILTVASEELEKFEQIIKELEGQQQSAREFLNMKHFTFHTDSKLTSLHVKHKEVSQQIKNISNKIQMEQRGVVTLRKTVNEIESQISDLDAAKEIAKRERNFREAKRLKEEREALTQEGIESQEKLESLLKELAEDRKLLEKAQSENVDIEAEISEKDRLAALVTVEEACVVIQVLQEQINRVGDDSLVKALLETEAKTCKNLISDLCNKHDIPMPDLDNSQVENQREDIELKETVSELAQSSEGEALQGQTEDYNELVEKLSELEGRLEAVVEIEDFDEADILS